MGQKTSFGDCGEFFVPWHNLFLADYNNAIDVKFGRFVHVDLSRMANSDIRNYSIFLFCKPGHVIGLLGCVCW